MSQRTIPACPICREYHEEPRGFSYDGRGVNSCGMYRGRIANILAGYHHVGPLLAAAPDLLTALERVVVYIESAGLIPPCVREARKIINKAKGGE